MIGLESIKNSVVWRLLMVSTVDGLGLIQNNQYQKKRGFHHLTSILNGKLFFSRWSGLTNIRLTHDKGIV